MIRSDSRMPHRGARATAGAVLLLLAAPLISQSWDDGQLNLRDYPATAGLQNLSGIASSVPLDLSDPNLDLEGFRSRIVFGTGSFGYERLGGQDLLSSTSALSLLPNLSAGVTTRWIPTVAYLDTRVQFLARPLDLLSASVDALIPASGSSFTAGGELGLRPLALLGKELGHRLTVGARLDASVETDLSALSLGDATLGLAAEPLDGLRLNGSYNLDSGAITVGVDLAVRENGIRVSAPLDSNFQPGILSVESNVSFRPRPSRILRQRDLVVESSLPAAIPDIGVTGVGFLPPGGGLRELQESINRIAADDRISTLVFVNQRFSGSISNLLAVLDSLQQLRDAGKQLVFYYDTAGSGDYLLAAGIADQIIVSPAGIVNLQAPAASRLYFAALFERFGIEVLDFASHPFKTANDGFARTDMSPEERESLEPLVSNWTELLGQALERGRGDRLSGTGVEALEGGPYFRPDLALERGLIDDVGFQEDLYEIIGADRDREPLRERRTDWADAYLPRVALVYLSGPVVPGSGVGGAIIGGESAAALLYRIAESDRYDAVVLRIDSGGGVGYAGEQITNAVRAVVDAGIPIVTSMGGTAASAAYQIASATDFIIATPATVTGSIGVTALNFNATGLLAEYGVGYAVVGQQPFLDPFVPVQQEDLEQYRDYIDYSYERFVGQVAEDREMSPEDVDAVARGRVWTAADALERGLIDGLGSLDDAIAEGAERAGLSGEVQVVELVEQPEFTVGGLMLGMAARLGLGVEPLQRGARTIRVLEGLSSAPVLWLSPVTGLEY